MPWCRTSRLGRVRPCGSQQFWVPTLFSWCTAAACANIAGLCCVFSLLACWNGQTCATEKLLDSGSATARFICPEQVALRTAARCCTCGQFRVILSAAAILNMPCVVQNDYFSWLSISSSTNGHLHQLHHRSGAPSEHNSSYIWRVRAHAKPFRAEHNAEH